MGMIFLVDDELVVLQALEGSITSIGHSVRGFSSAQECLKALKREACDLILTDVNMPEMDGLTLLSRLKELRPHLPVLIMSAYGDIPMALRAVKAGALDFLEKPLSEDTLFPAIQKALADSVVSKGVEFTETERTILKFVALGSSTPQIAETLKRSVRTIENHRQRIMKKIGVNSSSALVHFALKHGFDKLPDPEAQSRGA